MPENKGNSASDYYGVKQLDGTDTYGDNSLDDSWRHKTGAIRGDVAGDVQARELAENDVVRDARRKIMEILDGDDDVAPQRRSQQAPTGRVRPKNRGLSFEELSEGLDMQHENSLLADAGLTSDDLAELGLGVNAAADRAAVDLVQQGYVGEGGESAELAESMAGRPQAPAEPTWDWVTAKNMATLRSGKKVPVWTVENKSTGMGMNKPFRIQAPAERIASVLNVTGNVNDPRIRQIHEDYDRYVSLSKQLRKAKQLHESGDANAKKTGQRIVVELRGVKQRLGI